MATRTARVSLDTANKWVATVQVGPHGLVSDVPPDKEGNDLGPTPEELLLSAWGSCTAMTVGMYAKHKQWPLKNVFVTLEWHKGGVGKLDQFVRRVRFEGELDEAQRARLVEIAERCPVHKAFTGQKEVVTREEEKEDVHASVHSQE